MAIINNLNGDKVEFTGVSRVWNNTKYDFEEIYFGDKQIFSIWAELESPLPITIFAAGEDLIDYRIYGADGGVGEPAENLYNYANDTADAYIIADGSIVRIGSSVNYVSEKIPVIGGKTYTLIAPLTIAGNVLYAAFYGDDDTKLSAINITSVSPPYEKTYTITAPSGASYFRTSIKRAVGAQSVTMFAEGSTAPASYIPFGYKLPMVVRSRNLFDKNATNTDNGFVANAYLTSNGIVVDYVFFNVSEYISIKPNTAYYAQNVSHTSVSDCSVCFYTADHTFISGRSYNFKIDIPFTTPANAAYVRMSVMKYKLDIITLIEGTEPPSKYIPYSKQTVPIYIGSDTLAEDEYVDFGEQKVYKRTSNLFNIRKVASNIVTITGDNEFQKAETEKVWYDLFDHQTSDSPTRKADTTKCLYLEAGTYTLSGTAKLPDDDYADLYYVLTAQSNGTILAATALPYTFTLAADNYITIRIGTTHRVNMSQIMITAGSETPSTYESYLTPTDPPVPIPALPTIEGETIIDYNPSTTPAVEPEKMYTKYRKEGF